MITTFQRPDVAKEFVDRRRKALPFAEEQIGVMLRVISHFGTPARFVDLGCGDGILSRAVLNAFPDSVATLVDHSSPMLARAEQSMQGYGDRVRMVEADLSNGMPDVGEVDLVISGFAIHHLPNDRKQALYGEIYHSLTLGGLFINMEHVTPGSASLEALFDLVYIDNVVELTGLPAAQVAAEYHGRPDKADNKLETVERQMQWLCDIGYVNVDCYFKFLEIAMFGGVKPKAV